MKPSYADGRNPTFGELLWFKGQFQPYTDNPAHSPQEKIHGYYSRIQSLVQTALQNASRDYRRWFLPDDKSPLPRQQRWEMLRGIRDEHNELWIEYFENWLEWIESAFNSISREYWEARADIKTFERIANVTPNPPSVVAADLISEVVKWHRNDGGYWKHCCFSVATDDEAHAALTQLETSDSNYPLNAKSAEFLIQELQVERSIVLRHCKTERQNSNEHPKNKQIEWETKDQIASRFLTPKGTIPDAGNLAKLLNEMMPDDARKKSGDKRNSPRLYKVNVAVELIAKEREHWRLREQV